MRELKFLPMEEGVILPCYETEGSAGMDLRAHWGYDDAGCTLYPGGIRVISTGLKVDIPPGYELQVRPRSGLAFNHGVTVLNSPGTIDSDFKGEIKVCLINHGSFPVKIKEGDRVCQLVYSIALRVSKVEVKEVKREGGFESTGRD